MASPLERSRSFSPPFTPPASPIHSPTSGHRAVDVPIDSEPEARMLAANTGPSLQCCDNAPVFSHRPAAHVHLAGARSTRLLHDADSLSFSSACAPFDDRADSPCARTPVAVHHACAYNATSSVASVHGNAPSSAHASLDVPREGASHFELGRLLGRRVCSE